MPILAETKNYYSLALNHLMRNTDKVPFNNGTPTASYHPSAGSVSLGMRKKRRSGDDKEDKNLCVNVIALQSSTSQSLTKLEGA